MGKTISVTPTVTTAGYITSGTAKNVTVSLSASVNIRHSSDLTANGATITAPAGYYASNASKAVATGTAGTPTATKGVANLGIGLWESGFINAITGATADSNYRIRLTDYIEITNEIQIASDSASAEYALRIYKADYSYVETEVVWHGDTMNLDEYLSTNFASDYSTFKYFKLIARYTDDRTVSSGAVAALGGLINISKNKITITPSVTNTTGYITGRTETGTPVTVSASELVSGTKIVNTYGTSNVANYENVFVGVPLITGTFTGTSAGAINISIPYTGNGYPVIIMIYPTEGPFNESTGDFYNLIANQAAASIVGIKARMDVAPEYGSNVTQNHMVLSVTQKNSSSSATSYAAARAVSYMYQDSDSTGAGSATLLRLKDYTTMSVYIRGSSGYGFAQNIEYTYKIIYSE